MKFSAFVCLYTVGEISSYQDEIETELENSRPKLRGIYAMYAKEGTVLHPSLFSLAVYFCKCAITLRCFSLNSRYCLFTFL